MRTTSLRAAALGIFAGTMCIWLLIL